MKGGPKARDHVAEGEVTVAVEVERLKQVIEPRGRSVIFFVAATAAAAASTVAVTAAQNRYTCVCMCVCVFSYFVVADDDDGNNDQDLGNMSGHTTKCQVLKKRTQLPYSPSFEADLIEPLRPKHVLCISLANRDFAMKCLVEILLNRWALIRLYRGALGCKISLKEEVELMIPHLL